MDLETLDQTYYNPISQVQSLLKKLTQGPDVKAEDASALLSFTPQSQSAFALHRHKSIASLEDHTTMHAVVGRLDNVLRREWFTHVQTLPSHHAHMPTFQDFASWIQQKSHIARLDRNSRLDRDKHKPKPGQAHADAVPKATSSIHTLPNPQQTAQTKKSQNPMPQAKNAAREGKKSTAMPLAVTRTLLTPPYSTKTCKKKSTMPQIPQEAVTLHPNQMSHGVLGAPKLVALTIIQPPTALC